MQNYMVMGADLSSPDLTPPYSARQIRQGCEGEGGKGLTTGVSLPNLPWLARCAARCLKFAVAHAAESLQQRIWSARQVLSTNSSSRIGSCPGTRR